MKFWHYLRMIPLNVEESPEQKWLAKRRQEVGLQELSMALCLKSYCQERRSLISLSSSHGPEFHCHGQISGVQTESLSLLYDLHHLHHPLRLHPCPHRPHHHHRHHLLDQREVELWWKKIYGRKFRKWGDATTHNFGDSYWHHGCILGMPSYR